MGKDERSSEKTDKDDTNPTSNTGTQVRPTRGGDETNKWP